MTKKAPSYIIGVDGGGTKTIAALADLKGKIIVKAKSGSSNPRNVGLKKAVSNIVLALKPLLKKIKKGKIFTTIIALPAVEEEYREKKREILRLLKTKKEISKIFKGEIKIVSDQEASFRAGTNKKDGVVLISGTGCVAHGWRENKAIKTSGWGYLADEGSAFWVGQRAFQAVLKDLDKRGEKTILTKLAFQKFKTKKISDFLKKIYSKNPTEIIPLFSIICDKASQKGDKIAKKIMVEAARELALAGKTVIKKLNFQKDYNSRTRAKLGAGLTPHRNKVSGAGPPTASFQPPAGGWAPKFPLVLVGSMFKSKIVLNEVKKEIKKVAKKAQFILVKKEPVIGAIKLALGKI